MILPPADIKLYSVPPVWEEDTFVLVGCGPSLTAEQLKYVREGARVIAINSSYKLAPWADVLYGGDSRFWRWYENAPEFCGVRVGLAWDAMNGELYTGYKDIDRNKVRFMMATGIEGLESDSRGLKHGKNSGYAAINLAVHFGAKRIVLIGYDMQPDGNKHHWHGDQPEPIPNPPYELFLECFDSIVDPLNELGVQVFNCTPGSALEVFPKAELVEVV